MMASNIPADSLTGLTGYINGIEIQWLPDALEWLWQDFGEATPQAKHRIEVGVYQVADRLRDSRATIRFAY
jgi:hypothetical protein